MSFVVDASVAAKWLVPENDSDKAEELLQQSLHVEPTAFACRVLGSIKLDSGKAAEAIPMLEQAYTMSDKMKAATPRPLECGGAGAGYGDGGG